MNRIIGAVFALFLAAPAFAHEFTLGDLEVGHPHIPAPIASAKSAGGYLSITNGGESADRLIGAESDAADKTELHTSEVDAEGVARMIHVPAIDIPAGETVKLERGGLHVMFMGLKTPLAEGDLVKGTLIFEKAGRLDVEFSVDAPKDGEGHGHGDMAH
ncbi:copper chaperone PCu(A)C [Pseudogemmobacter humi]|uniref:Copper chaperone PCu(A)C n=1 Tax=Pseudogemmobacter humi TaxID=2483812 RepID=A0A3P5X005_9RHOB|nr:copper chaperone PCu(A)C [Pseudogemmobacter humi]VDC24531.1 hypothetical protein XINFAN_01228 [Pseudogemmobacter humi]